MENLDLKKPLVGVPTFGAKEEPKEEIIFGFQVVHTNEGIKLRDLNGVNLSEQAERHSYGYITNLAKDVENIKEQEEKQHEFNQLGLMIQQIVAAEVKKALGK